jgi:hypothetical protein
MGRCSCRCWVNVIDVKQDDLHWVAGLALDAVGGLIIGEATKALIRVQKKHAKAVFDAVQYGIDAPKLSEQIAGVSKEAIEGRVKAAGSFATKQGKAVVTGATNEESHAKKEAQKSYLDKLEDAVDANYREFYLDVRNNATDAQLLVFQEGMLPQYHEPSAYKAAVDAKLKAYMQSGVTDIGRRILDSRKLPSDPVLSEHAGDIEDRRVVWVNAGGERLLYFQHHFAEENPSTIKAGEPLYENLHPKHKPTFGERDGETKIGKPVPREFWDIAVSFSEARWGTTPLLLLSKEQVRELTGYNPPAAKQPASPSSPVRTDARGAYGPSDLASDVGGAKSNARPYEPSDLMAAFGAQK